MTEQMVTITVTEASIGEQLGRLIEEGLTAEQAASTVLQHYRPAPLADVVWPAVRDMAIRLQRAQARSTEQMAFQQDPIAATHKAVRSARDRLESLTFRTGTGEEVSWGRATVLQHRGRIEWQSRNIAGIQDDINRHQWAIDTIREHGVSRLDEVPAWTELLSAKVPAATIDA